MAGFDAKGARARPGLRQAQGRPPPLWKRLFTELFEWGCVCVCVGGCFSGPKVGK